jgi:hypothetical protein
MRWNGLSSTSASAIPDVLSFLQSAAAHAQRSARSAGAPGTRRTGDLLVHPAQAGVHGRAIIREERARKTDGDARATRTSGEASGEGAERSRVTRTGMRRARLATGARPRARRVSVLFFSSRALVRYLWLQCPDLSQI